MTKPDILDMLEDLHKQATTERSHRYVGACAKAAIEEIKKLRKGAVTTIHTAELAELREKAAKYDGLCK
jgi:hypothetical protein